MEAEAERQVPRAVTSLEANYRSSMQQIEIEELEEEGTVFYSRKNDIMPRQELVSLLEPGVGSSEFNSVEPEPAERTPSRKMLQLG